MQRCFGFTLQIQDMKELAAKEKADARAKRRAERVGVPSEIDSKAREEAIARGEAVPEMEPAETEEAPADASNSVQIRLNDDGATLTDVAVPWRSHAVNQQQRRDSGGDRRSRRDGTHSPPPAPQNTRCFSVEKAIADEFPNARLILVVTKIDFVPRAQLTALLDTLSAELPVVLWKNPSPPPKPRPRRRKPTHFFGVRNTPRQNGFAHFAFGPDYLMEVRSSPRFHLVSPQHPEVPRGLDQCRGDRLLRRGPPHGAPHADGQLPAVPRGPAVHRGAVAAAAHRRRHPAFHGSRGGFAADARAAALRLPLQARRARVRRAAGRRPAQATADSAALCRDLVEAVDARTLSFFYQIPAFAGCTPARDR